LEADIDVLLKEPETKQPAVPAAATRTAAGIDESAYFPKPRPAIKSTLAAIRGRRVPGADRDSVTALNRLNAYRYLCDVPSDVGLSDSYTRLAEAAAALCHRLGRIEHHPENPGMDEAEFEQAYTGTSQSNLHVGRGMAGCVDSFMHDSDPGNIRTVGHRRWCLNPVMALTGFGEKERYAAMYAFDRSREEVPDLDFVAYPPRGFAPLSYFADDRAWSVSPNPERYRDVAGVRREDVKVRRIKRGHLREVLNEPGVALDLDYFNVDGAGFGTGACIIFRPRNLRLRARDRFRVDISGLKTLDGTDTAISYLVEFTDL
jgi:hypothetical protein